MPSRGISLGRSGRSSATRHSPRDSSAPWHASTPCNLVARCVAAGLLERWHLPLNIRKRESTGVQHEGLRQAITAVRPRASEDWRAFFLTVEADPDALTFGQADDLLAALNAIIDADRWPPEWPVDAGDAVTPEDREVASV